MIDNYFIYKFFEDFTNDRNKTNKAIALYFLSCRPFLNILKYKIHDEAFQQFAKKDSLRHHLKSSGSMLKSSGLEFFRNTTGTQSRLDAFDNLKFVMIF